MTFTGQRLDGVESVLDAVLTANRGGDGALGADAVGVAIPAGKYIRRTLPDQLRHKGYPPEAFDRRYDYLWLDNLDEPDAANDYEDPQQRYRTLELVTGYLCGESWLAYVHLQSGTDETRLHAATYPHKRADNDAGEMRAALCFPPMHQVMGANPYVDGITRLGATRYEDQGEGRLLAVSRYRVLITEARGIYLPAH